MKRRRRSALNVGGGSQRNRRDWLELSPRGDERNAGKSPSEGGATLMPLGGRRRNGSI